MTKVPFAVVAALFDQTGDLAANRPGGSTDAQRDLIDRAWRVILASRAETAADLDWRLRRLARAVENG